MHPSLIWKIARRYLISKKSTQAINLITWVSVVGISIGTAALILILSIFNGFESLLTDMLSHFNPDIKVVPVEGKYIDTTLLNLHEIKDIKGISYVGMSLEETAFFDYDGVQEIGIIKGMDQEAIQAIKLEEAIIRGNIIEDSTSSFGLIGAGLNNKLSINPNNTFTPIQIYLPQGIQKGPLDKGFNTLPVYPSGVFSVSSDVDMLYCITDIETVASLLDKKDHISALEIQIDHPRSEESILTELKRILGPKYTVKNRYAQDEGFLKIMNIEKWVSYLIACLTMLIVAFNMVGSLWMIVLEKKHDLAILKSMGMTSDNIQGIFIRVGYLIAWLGLAIGLLLATLFYFLQKNFGLIGIPDGFMIDAYPIEFRFWDFILVIITVTVIAFVASYLPAKKAAQGNTYIKYE